MKPLSRLESLIAEIVERPAWLLSSRRLHPLELNAALTRALDARALRLADRVLAPDSYTLRLHPKDFAAFADAVPALERELAGYLARVVEERDLACSRSPIVRITADESVRSGTAQVEAAFSDSERATAPAGLPRALGHEPGGAPSGYGLHDGGSTLSRAPAGPALLVQGPAGIVVRTLALDHSPLTVGRSNTCDLVLADTNVSREHLRLTRDGGSTVVEDLRSRNGTSLNGRPLEQPTVLRHDDELQVGRVRLRYSDAGAAIG